jgi:hypothetical protein
MQTHTTRGQFKSQLARLLEDENKIHWTDNELNLIINESLYTLGAFGYFRDRGGFSTNLDDRFYDITTGLVSGSGEKILDLSLTFGDIINKICYDLLETVNDANIFNIFTQAQMLEIIDRRLDEFKLQTGLILSIDEFSVASGRVDLGNEVLDFIRVAFKDVSDAGSSKWRYYKLFKEDEEDLQGWVSDFTTTVKKRPKSYSRVSETQNIIKLYPQFENTGKLHLIEIRSRDKSLTLSTETILGIPNNLAFYLKYGVLEDLLKSDTALKDLYRANYCRQRWQEGLIVSRNYNSVLNGEINGRNRQLSTIEDLDGFETNWHNNSGTPNRIALAGYNLLTLNKLPTSEIGITLDVVRNAIIPTDDDSYLQIKAEHVELLLNYSYHVAFFKEGYNAINSSIIALNNFADAIMVYNSKLAKEFVSYQTMMKKSLKQEIQVSRFDSSIIQQSQQNATATN